MEVCIYGTGAVRCRASWRASSGVATPTLDLLIALTVLRACAAGLYEGQSQLAAAQ